jgi:hypothetical protein
MAFFGISKVEPHAHFWGLPQFSTKKGAAGDHSISGTECVSAKVPNVLSENVSLFHPRQT